MVDGWTMRAKYEWKSIYHQHHKTRSAHSTKPWHWWQCKQGRVDNTRAYTFSFILPVLRSTAKAHKYQLFQRALCHIEAKFIYIFHILLIFRSRTLASFAISMWQIQNAAVGDFTIQRTQHSPPPSVLVCSCSVSTVSSKPKMTSSCDVITIHFMIIISMQATDIVWQYFQCGFLSWNPTFSSIRSNWIILRHPQLKLCFLNALCSNPFSCTHTHKSFRSHSDFARHTVVIKCCVLRMYLG